MMNKIGILLVAILPATASSEMIGGVEFSEGEISFADRVVSYTPGSNASGSYAISSNAIGLPDYESVRDAKYVSLGDEGELVVQFTNNALTTSGDSNNDLWIFEVGPIPEPTAISISQNGSEWIDVGSTVGGAGGIDIDQYVNQGVVAGQKYTFVKIVDLLPTQSPSPWGGADIDAIGAISSTDGPCGDLLKVSPATYEKSSGKLNIPAVIADGKCYALELDCTPGVSIDFLDVCTKSSLNELTLWLTASDYQTEFDQQVENGFYPREVEGRNFDGESQFRGKFVPIPPNSFVFESIHGHEKGSYEGLNSSLIAQDYTQIHLQTFVNSEGITLYQAIWEKRD